MAKNLEGALPPLQSTLQEGKTKECPQASMPSFLIAVTTNRFASKACYLFHDLIKRQSGFRGIKRTLKGKDLTVKSVYSWSAVMQSGNTQTLKRFADTTLQTGNAH